MSQVVMLPALVRDYVRKMFELGGMKVLLLDKETTPSLSVVYSQMEILNKEVFLVQRLDEADGTDNSHLKAVVFIRPTPENIRQLRRHLKLPHYSEYHLYFTNIVRDSLLQDLADADESQCIKSVQEVFFDYRVLDKHVFVVPVPYPSVVLGPMNADRGRSSQAADKMVEGIASLLLTLKRKPLIRYSGSSEFSKTVANNLWHLIYQQEVALFDYRQGDTFPIVLIIDRLDDPVTPLLSQWTYQAMVHELFGIKDNRVSLEHLPKVPKDQKQIVLSAEQDDFFRDNMYLNYGDLGANMKEIADEYMSSKQNNQNIQSIEDMAKFLENYPEFRQKSVTVSKHLALLTELSRAVDERSLMSVSGMEQDLACSQLNLATAVDGIEEVLSNPSVTANDALRLVLIFLLRFEGKCGRELRNLTSRLEQRGASSEQIRLLETIIDRSGVGKRTGDLFGDRNFLKRASKMAKTMRGVENVYTQHQPLLTQTIEECLKGRLKESEYPYVNKPGTVATQVPTEVIVFVVGGATYEEARAVALMNAEKEKERVRIFLGGTCMQSSATFLKDMLAVQSRESYDLR